MIKEGTHTQIGKIPCFPRLYETQNIDFYRNGANQGGDLLLANKQRTVP